MHGKRGSEPSGDWREIFGSGAAALSQDTWTHVCLRMATAKRNERMQCALAPHMPYPCRTAEVAGSIASADHERLIC